MPLSVAGKVRHFPVLGTVPFAPWAAMHNSWKGGPLPSHACLAEGNSAERMNGGRMDWEAAKKKPRLYTQKDQSRPTMLISLLIDHAIDWFIRILARPRLFIAGICKEVRFWFVV